MEERRSTLLTIAEALADMRIGRTQFAILRKAGKIRTVTIGARGVRVPFEEIKKFVDDQIAEQTK